MKSIFIIVFFRRMAIMHCQLVLSMQFAPDKKSRTTPTRYNSEDIALCYSHLIELLNEVLRLSCLKNRVY